MHAIMHAADIQDRDGGALLMATLFSISFSPETLRRWWISGRRLPKCIADYSQARERRDRQALRSSPALRRAPKTLARRADLRLARAMPKAGQGLGMSQPQSARFPQARFYSPHASKAMQSKMMFPDRLSGKYHAACRRPACSCPTGFMPNGKISGQAAMVSGYGWSRSRRRAGHYVTAVGRACRIIGLPDWG